MDPGQSGAEVVPDVGCRGAATPALASASLDSLYSICSGGGHIIIQNSSKLTEGAGLHEKVRDGVYNFLISFLTD